MSDQPRYSHGCLDCTFLGSFTDYSRSPSTPDVNGPFDLYFCPQLDNSRLGPTVVARWSGAGPDYMSGMSFVARLPALAEAKKRAIDRGLFTGGQATTTARGEVSSCGHLKRFSTPSEKCMVCELVEMRKDRDEIFIERSESDSVRRNLELKLHELHGRLEGRRDMNLRNSVSMHVGHWEEMQFTSRVKAYQVAIDDLEEFFPETKEKKE